MNLHCYLYLGYIDYNMVYTSNIYDYIFNDNTVISYQVTDWIYDKLEPVLDELMML